jgi:lipopolysaccharide transport system ATP-binding protein
MTAIIETENLSKKYIISTRTEIGYSTLVETLARTAVNCFQALRHPFKKNTQPINCMEDFWALRDINIEIKQGDRIGIIGRNGAGKSTLLKILSRIVTPSSGRIKIRGRVASLLEVGTGFHPELSGRENIFLNGAILGMGRREIESKFDEIVCFSEVGKFLDTPVKRFSSGMITRLGFAIAAHLDPDLLIVDEVLAVGDAIFQQKCLKKIGEMGNQGRTVIFVSHDVGSILSICNKGIFLEDGTVKEHGPIEACVNAYMRTYSMQSSYWKGDVGDEHIRFYSASLTSNNLTKEFFYQGDATSLEIEYEVLKPSHDLNLGVGIWNLRNQLIARSHTTDDVQNHHKYIKKGRHKLTLHIDSGMFHEGDYFIKVDCGLHNHKKIISVDIVLKYPIYVSDKSTRDGHLSERDGIFLGKNWDIMTDEVYHS